MSLNANKAQADTIILRTEGLTRHYSGIRAVHNLSLDLHRGEIHALIGPNGAGKTTAINLIMGEINADTGSIYLDQKDVTKLPLWKRSQLGMGRTYQITSIIREISVADNLTLSLLSQTHESYINFHDRKKQVSVQLRVEELLHRFNLNNIQQKLAGQLSHGEQGRLEIAMCLACQPRVLLMDEPMSGMSHADSREIIELLESIRNDVAILLVEHDMDAVFRLSNRISVMASGETIASGSPEQIKENQTVIQAYLGDQ